MSDNLGNLYRPGGYYVICDVCGYKVRGTETRMRWDGLRVCHHDWEPRHPQDGVKGRRDRQTVPNARPEGPDVFLEDNEVTAGDL